MSDDYDNFVGKKAEVEKRGNLSEFLGVKDEEPWEKHWVCLLYTSPSPRD